MQCETLLQNGYLNSIELAKLDKRIQNLETISPSFAEETLIIVRSFPFIHAGPRADETSVLGTCSRAHPKS